jgi:hypothetical protein
MFQTAQPLHCSSFLFFRNVQLCSCANPSLIRHKTMFQAAQPLHRSSFFIIQKCTVVQKCKCAVVQMCRCTVVQLCKASKNVKRSDEERQHFLSKESAQMSTIKLMLDSRGSPPCFWPFFRLSGVFLWRRHDDTSPFLIRFLNINWVPYIFIDRYLSLRTYNCQPLLFDIIRSYSKRLIFIVYFLTK